MGRETLAIEERSERTTTAMIVASDPSSRESLCKVLAECQIRAVLAANSVDALEVLRAGRIDVLICEDLGGLYGVELLEMCEALFPDVRRVYLARNATPEVHCEAIVRGHVHATVSDSMHPVDLRNAIASLARR